MRPIVATEAINVRVYLTAEDLEFLAPMVERGQMSKAGAVAMIARAGLDAVRGEGRLTLPLKLAVDGPAHSAGHGAAKLGKMKAG